MTFLPIVERELRVASRQRGTYWVRLAAAGVALLIGGWIMLLPGFNSPRTLGIALFVSLAIFTFVYCVLAGLRTTADSLSEEKREGTLGLLFLTDLRGYDIVLGKLVATSLNAFYGILAVFPVMAIPLLLGGVSVAEFWRVILCSLNALFFSLAVGMFASAISRDERKAMFTALALLLFFVGGLPLTGAILAEYYRHPLEPLFFIPSPGFACFAAFDETYQQLIRTRFNFFHVSVLCVHIMSWGFLVLTCLIVPRSWQDRPSSTARVERHRLWHRLKHGVAGAQARWRSHMLSYNPVYWLTSRDRTKPVWVWLMLILGGLLWLWGLVDNPRDWRSEPAYLMTALAAHSILKIWIASEASRQFAFDRKSGALELLLSTPIKVREIVGGQLSSLQRQFLFPCLVVLLVDFLFLRAEWSQEEWIVVWLAGMAVFVADMVTLSWVGMWKGLSTANTSRASAFGVLVILVLPWLVFAGIMTFLALAEAFSGAGFGFGFQITVFLWFAISMGFDIVFGLMARRGLLRNFRSVAARSSGKRPRTTAPSAVPKAASAAHDPSAHR